MIKCNLWDCAYYDKRKENNCEEHFDCKDCKFYLRDNSIQLIPIKNEDMETNKQYLKKFQEESGEFRMACHSLRYYEFVENNHNMKKLSRENVIEEFYDCIQIMLQTMIYLGFTLEEIIEAQEKHFQKLESRGWEL